MKSKFAISKLHNIIGVALGITLAANISMASAGVNDTGLAVTDKTVTVGILHSLTGTMAISETGAQEAEKLAIKQINEMGGILGRQIKNHSGRWR